MPDANEKLTIRDAKLDDALAIADIYNHYVEGSIITFEEQQVTVPEIRRRLEAVQDAKLPWFVVEEAGEVVGYAYGTPWKSRSAYRFSVESTIYMHPAHTGYGTGSLLYGQLLSALHERSVHVVLAGISLPNSQSVALHEKLGFTKVAHFSQVGFKFGRWIDVGYWQHVF